MRKKTKSIIKHGFIYVMFAIFFILLAFGLEALLRDMFFKSSLMALLAVLIGVFGTVFTFLVMKGKVKWT